MNLQDTLQSIQDQLDKRAQALDVREAELANTQATLDGRVDEITQGEQSVRQRTNDLDAREARISAIETQQNTYQANVTLLGQLSEKQAQLRQAESDLADIEAGQKQKEQELLQREQAVSVREQEYKQTLKDEFFAEVAKRLPS